MDGTEAIDEELSRISRQFEETEAFFERLRERQEGAVGIVLIDQSGRLFLMCDEVVPNDFLRRALRGEYGSVVMNRLGTEPE